MLRSVLNPQCSSLCLHYAAASRSFSSCSPFARGQPVVAVNEQPAETCYQRRLYVVHHTTERVVVEDSGWVAERQIVISRASQDDTVHDRDEQGRSKLNSFSAVLQKLNYRQAERNWMHLSMGKLPEDTHSAMHPSSNSFNHKHFSAVRLRPPLGRRPAQRWWWSFVYQQASVG